MKKTILLGLTCLILLSTPTFAQTNYPGSNVIGMGYDRASKIIASQIPVTARHEKIGEGTITDAILDRLVYASDRVELKGELRRKKRVLKG